MWIEHEDYERAKELDEMFLQEKEQEMWNEYWQYETEQNNKQLPAKVTMLIPKLDEIHTDSLPF